MKFLPHLAYTQTKKKRSEENCSCSEREIVNVRSSDTTQALSLSRSETEWYRYTVTYCRSLSCTLLALSTLFVSSAPLQQARSAEPSFDVVNALTIKNGASVGDIISRDFASDTYQRARDTETETIIGVVISPEEAVAVYSESAEALPVARRGMFRVSVSAVGGPIHKGDFITTSPIPGLGQRASGVSQDIVGMALEPFDGKGETTMEFEGKQIARGTILVDLASKPNAQNLGALKDLAELARKFGITFLGQFQTTEGASLVFRYILAGLVTVICVYFAFRHFGQAVLRGIEAIGRNPLAKAHIQTAIIINAIIILLVSVSVVVLSLIIIRL